MSEKRLKSEREYEKDVFTDKERLLLGRLRYQGLHPKLRRR